MTTTQGKLIIQIAGKTYIIDPERNEAQPVQDHPTCKSVLVTIQVTIFLALVVLCFYFAYN